MAASGFKDLRKLSTSFMELDAPEVEFSYKNLYFILFENFVLAQLEYVTVKEGIGIFPN